MPDEAAEPQPIAVLDPLEEVLQQLTEQTVRLNHVEAGLKELNKSLTDLSETTQAGLVEIRSFVAQAPQQARPATVELGRALGERLDELETAHKRTSRTQLVLLVALALELVATLFVVLVSTGALSFKKKSEEFTFAPPGVTGPAVAAPTPEPLPLPPSPTREPARAVKRRGHR